MFKALRFKSTTAKESSVEVSKFPVLGKTVPDMQDWAVKMNGGSWSEDGEAQLWIREDVYLSHQAITAFLEVAREMEGPVHWRAAGLVGNFIEEIAFSESTPMMIWFSKSVVWSDDHIEQSAELTIDVKAYPITVPAPQSDAEADLVQLPITDAVVIPTGHWSQTLWANLLGVAPYLWRELVGDNAFTMMRRLFWAFICSFSREPHKLIRRFRSFGEDCRIHPSAVVEGSIIGDNVTIGANAVVRGSVVRDNVRIEDLALVEGSVLSNNVVVQRQGMVKFSVLDEGASVAGVVQLSLLGAGASVKRGAYLMDIHFSKAVRVQVDDRLEDAPLGMIGCYIGENTTIGLGVAVAAGRVIPAGLQITCNPSTILTDPTTVKATGLCWVEDGTLRGHNAN